ncbi:MAG TPA: DUF58 domain-containing protein [Actinomycetota bacterium]|nr:DUF58 domain-containing protein [Actinomycetota bacterium]
MYLSPRLAVAAVAAALVAAALVAVFVSVPFWVGLVAANVVVLALLVFDVSRAPNPRTLRPARAAPRIVTIEHEAEIEVQLHNPLARPLLVAVRDATPPSARREPRFHRATLASRSALTLGARIAPSRRGVVQVGPVTVRTVGPFRLGGRQATLPLLDRVKVYPALPGRAEVELRIERARLLQSGERSSMFRGGGTEFDALRDYHPDDEFRRINWTATARAAKPITNVYREERNQRVMVLLDASRTMAGSIEGVSRFEHAIDAAVAVAELAARVGDQVGMIAFGSQVAGILGPRGGRAQPRRIVDLLFDLQPSLDAPDYRGAFGVLLSRYRRRSFLVLFTELAEETTMESLFAAIPVLLPHHLLMVASVVDPEVLALRDEAPGSYDSAYLGAAAAASLDARDRTARRLRAMGVMVEDREPTRLAGAVADGYLRVKSAGRL